MNQINYTLTFIYKNADYVQFEREELTKEEFQLLHHVLEWMRNTDYGKFEVNVATDPEKGYKFFDMAPTERMRLKVALVPKV